MAKQKTRNKFVSKDSITEEIKLIDGSDTDYVTPTGKIYKDFGDGNMFLRSNFENKYNGYIYTTVTYKDGQKQRRVHKLVANAYVENDDPEHKNVVMHIDNDKTNNSRDNLKWGAMSENTKDAYICGLAHNDKGFDDSQSIPVKVFDLDLNDIGTYGSISEASKYEGVTKRGIIYQCEHKVKSNKSRTGKYFRYLEEYEEKGFVL